MACIIQTGLHDITGSWSLCPAGNVASAISCDCQLLSAWIFTYLCVQSSVCFQCTYSSYLAEDMAAQILYSRFVVVPKLAAPFTRPSFALIPCPACYEGDSQLYVQKHEMTTSQTLCSSIVPITCAYTCIQGADV